MIRVNIYYGCGTVCVCLLRRTAVADKTHWNMAKKSGPNFGGSGFGGTASAEVADGSGSNLGSDVEDVGCM
jgi:uncharacterized membrane protein